MEQIDILKLFNLEPAKDLKYYAQYDLVSGKILSVGPDYSSNLSPDKTNLDNEMALQILDGRVPITAFVYDFDEKIVKLCRDLNLVKIDGILHRIIEEHYSDDKSPDIFLTVNRKSNSVKVQASNQYGGTKKVIKNDTGNKINFLNHGEKPMTFLVTEYNDPTIVFETFEIQVNDLIGKTAQVRLQNQLPKDFSIFTKRLFKKYSMAIK